MSRFESESSADPAAVPFWLSTIGSVCIILPSDHDEEDRVDVVEVEVVLVVSHLNAFEVVELGMNKLDIVNLQRSNDV